MPIPDSELEEMLAKANAYRNPNQFSGIKTPFDEIGLSDEKLEVKSDFDKKMSALNAERRGDDGPTAIADQKTEVAEMLAQLEAAQALDKINAGHDRRQAMALRAGQAVSSGMGGLQAENIPIPSRGGQTNAQDVEQRINLREKMLTGEKMRGKTGAQTTKIGAETDVLGYKLQDLEDIHSPEGGGTKIAQQVGQELGLDTTGMTGAQIMSMDPLIEEAVRQRIAVAQLEQKESQFSRAEFGRNERTDKMIKAGFANKVLGGVISEGSQGGRADAEFANRQAERQVVMYDDIKPHSATENTVAGELAGDVLALERVGSKAINVMRKNGRNFPMSTEWLKMDSDFMAMNQALNRLNQNGVMNFKDKENNDVQIGNPQQLKQFILNNGPEVLANALTTARTIVNARLEPRGYKYNPNWRAKAPSDYLGQSSGGGGNRSAPLQDPNLVPGLADYATKGGQFPKLRDAGGRQQPKQKKIVEQYGNLVKYDDGTYDDLSEKK